jgi:hypothetical protein
MFATFLKFAFPPYKGCAFRSKRSQLDIFFFLFDLVYMVVNFDLSNPIFKLIYISFSIKHGKIKFHI